MLTRHAKSICQLIRSLNIEQQTVAEIGVFRGETSEVLLLEFPKLHLFMVDVWSVLQPTPEQRIIDIGGENVLIADAVENNYKTALAVTKFAATRRTVIKTTSEEASTIVPDNLDLVFIDANHSYQYVRQDIELWWPKVRPGGILCGHDFSFEFRNVKRAVCHMATAWGLEIQRSRGSVWWWAKPLQ